MEQKEQPQLNLQGEPTKSAPSEISATATKQPESAVVKKEAYTPERAAEAIKKLPEELQGIKNLFAQPWESFRAAFADPKEADRIMQREITYAAQAMLANNSLIQCATKYPKEFVNALKNVALSGLSLSPTLKQGYLVPFKGKVSFMPSYMGMKDLLSNNGHVKKVEAYPVFDGDTFEIMHGTEERLIHKPNPWGERTKEKMLGCYWIATLTDGTQMFNNMTKAEIEAVMQRSPSVGQGKPSPWDTDYIEMATKTCLRRAFKAMPKGTISDEKLKVIEAVFDYDEKVEQDCIKEKSKSKVDRFDEEEVEYEEIKS